MSPAVRRYSARGAEVKGRRRDLARGGGSGGLIGNLNIQGQIPPPTPAPPLRATIDSIWPESKARLRGRREERERRRANNPVFTGAT